eukprot:jgi/Psemu1/64750/estExt_Genemark1.C_800053
MITAVRFVCTIGVAVILASGADALQMQTGPAGRRSVLQAGGAAAAALVAPKPCGAEAVARGEQQEEEEEELRRIVRSFSYNPKQKKQQQQQQQQPPIEWDPPDQDFSTELRYSASTLSDKEEIVPHTRCLGLPEFPSWMEGHWLCTYKFEGASFPRGRDQLSLRVPGAGLGTCAVLPNVGFNPAPFVQRFVSVDADADAAANAAAAAAASGSSTSSTGVVEDVAYNLPRKLEAFWPQAKVTAVRPPCLVTGDGCTPEENPLLHSAYATRCRMDYEGPTRSGGFRSQHLDLSMVDHSSTNFKNKNVGDDDFVVSRSFVQYNVEQELIGYYREFVSFDRQQQQHQQQQQQQQQQSSPSPFSFFAPASTSDQRLSNGKLRGSTRVAAFLPGSSDAVALYSYTMRLYSITGDEAMLY